jgi:hypothetical protein
MLEPTVTVRMKEDSPPHSGVVAKCRRISSRKRWSADAFLRHLEAFLFIYNRSVS